MDSPVTSIIRVSLSRTFPACPAAMVDTFVSWLARPREELVSLARMTLKKPYGHNYVLVDSGDFGISFACIEPGQGTSLHFHQRRREFFCVHEGVLALTRDDVESSLEKGESGFSTPGKPHALRNPSGAPTQVLEMFSPVLLEDKIRVSDRYARPLGQVSLRQ